MGIYKKQVLNICLALLVVACKKESNMLGLEVQPQYDQLSADLREIQPVHMFTCSNDSIVSFNDQYKYLGSNQDPAFGRTDVGLYLNANMEVSGLAPKDTAVLVSSEIVLEASGLE
jgi:hypothetical protein